MTKKHIVRENLRFIGVLLCSALIALSLAVCGGGGCRCQLVGQSGGGGKITNTQSGVSNNSRLNTTLDTTDVATPQKPAANVKPEYVPAEVLVRFKDDVSNSWDTLEAAMSGVAHEVAKVNVPAELLERFPFINVYRIKLPQNITVEDAIDRLKKNPNVLYAEPNYIYKNPDVLYAKPNYIGRITAIPNDPRFNELWGLNNTGQTGGTPDADIDAVEAWKIQTGSSSVVIAVIDTGVDYMHEDLAGNMWINSGEIPNDGIDNDMNGYTDDIYGINAVNGVMSGVVYDNGDPMDDNAHGTEVTGIMGAVGNNNIGIVGVNYNVKIMALKAGDVLGMVYTTDVVECLQYVLAMKDRGVNIKITNNSYSGVNYSSTFYDAIRAARDKDILFVAIAGNAGSDNDVTPSYPASYDLENIIAVAATDHNDNLATFSNYGATSVDVAAPGENILSTCPGVIPQPGDIFYDDMESGIGSWTADPPWAITNEDAVSGSFAWSDSPYANYADNLSKTITSPVIDLSRLHLRSGDVVRINFWIKQSLHYDPAEGSHDRLTVQFSPTGGEGWGGLGWTRGDKPWWRVMSRPITHDSYLASPSFMFSLRLFTDDSVNEDGVYIDDVGISLNRSSTVYCTASGTSMAAPYVSGIAALISAENPSLPYYQIKNAILNSVDVKRSLSGKVLWGGRVNAFNSLRTPLAPSDLSASAITNSQINLTWVDNSSRETGFKIERKAGASGAYTQIATAGANVTTYSSTGLSESYDYYYRVRAYTAETNSPYSNEASASPSLVAPSALSASVSSESSDLIDLTWVDNSTRETEFKIERKTGASGAYAQIATLGANATTYSDPVFGGSPSAYSVGIRVYYRVGAYNGSGGKLANIRKFGFSEDKF